MPRSTTILPPSSSDLEVDLLDTFIDVMRDKLESPNVPIKLLWNPSECPEAFLPYLACAFSVDGELSGFTVTQQRDLIKRSIQLHTIKGTVGSVKEAVEILGYEVQTLTEGERDPVTNEVIRTDGRWANFQVTITTPIPVKAANAAVALIEAVAPVSRKLILFSYNAVALSYDGGINSEGEYTLFGNGEYTHGEVNTANINR